MAQVEWVQTHISHVFLVGDRVYKLRKPVVFPFLDFETRVARNADCLREVALNRRLSPSVYLGVAPILWRDGSASVGATSESLAGDGCEHVTVMRRLPAGRDALSLLERGELTPMHVDAVAARLHLFHEDQGLGCPAPWSPEHWLERIATPVRESLAALADSELLATPRIADATARLEIRLAALEPCFEKRRYEGRAVDGHGDLHLDHVWFEQDHEPLLIDCLEFSDDLRRIDRASEVAFLSMDLGYRGRSDLAEYFLAVYAGSADDYGLYSVVDFYSAYRALVRAKVAALAARQGTVAPEQRRAARASAVRHFELAESMLGTPDGGSIVLLCGTVGSGKSTIARRLAEAGRGVPIRSDRVRKQLAGMPATARSDSGVDHGLYEPERRRRVYQAMLERASTLVAAGRTAILDASFTTREERDAARRWADEHDVPARLVEVRCSPEAARERLTERKRADRDPSDAGPELLPISMARFEPPDEWPASDRELIYSDRNEPTAFRTGVWSC